MPSFYDFSISMLLSLLTNKGDRRAFRECVLKVKVDKDACIGVGNCVAFAPTVFTLDKENKAVVLDAASVDFDTLLEAAKSCPENAIVIEDDEGLQLYP